LSPSLFPKLSLLELWKAMRYKLKKEKMLT
jgi:hypothetical protein